MSLGLLFPLGLAALAAWLVPLLIHLVRREEQRPTDFAALRWLSARLKPRAKVRFEDLVLLALRLGLIAALALLLARPVLFGGAGDAPWLLVVPGADAGAAPALPEGAQRRWLAPGFPPLESPMPDQPVPVSSLLRQLDAELPAATPVTVLVPEVFDGADGERPRLVRAVDWRIVDGVPADHATAAPAADILAVRYAPEREPALRYLRATAAAWRRLGDDPATDRTDTAGPAGEALDLATVDAPLPAAGTPLAWLVPGELPESVLAWIRAGGQALIEPGTVWPLAEPGAVDWRDAQGEPLARSAALGAGRLSQLQHPLSPAEMPTLLEPDFPHQLRRLLQPPAPAPTRARAEAHAPLPGGAGFPETPRELDSVLVWLVLALFALERGWAGRRRDAAA